MGTPLNAENQQATCRFLVAQVRDFPSVTNFGAGETGDSIRFSVTGPHARVAPEKEGAMPTYITLFQMTQQGAQQVKEMPNRVEQNRANMQKIGIELKSWHVTMGQYDVITVYDAPNDEAAAKLVLAIGLSGNVRTQTCRAFTMDEFKKVVGSLP
jgi:uncharacterized protein with GYD domain